MMLKRKIRKSKFSLVNKSGPLRSERLSTPRKSSPETERRRPTNAGSPVFSYYARGSKANGQDTARREEPGAKRQRRLQLGHVPSYASLIVIIIAILYSCYLQPVPKIVVLNTPGTVHRDPKAYQQAIETIWKQSLLNQTKLTVSTSSLQKDIQAQLSELASVRIELPLLGRRPTVTLVPGRPALQLVSKNGSFYVNAAGIVMARTTEITENQLADVILVNDETGISAQPGKGILSGPEVMFLTKLSAQLKAENIAVQSITIPVNAAKEADVRLNEGGYYIKFSFDSDPRQAVGSYIAAKTKLDTDRISPAEYIDVRVEEKVFYK